MSESSTDTSESIKNVIGINPFLCVEVSRETTELSDDIVQTTESLEAIIEIMENAEKPNIKIPNLENYLVVNSETQTKLYDSALTLKNFTDSNGVVLYLKNNLTNELFQCPKHLKKWAYIKSEKIECGKTLAAHVAITKQYEVIEDILTSPFLIEMDPDGIKKSVFCIPLITPELSRLIGVIELWKDVSKPIYSDDEIEAVLNYSMWMVTSLEEEYISYLNSYRSHIHDYFQEMISAYLFNELEPEIVLEEIMSVLQNALDSSAWAYSILKSDEVSAEKYYEMNLYNKKEIHKKIVNYEEPEVNTVTSATIKSGKILSFADGSLNDFDTLIYYPALCRNMISLPIKYKNETFAVLELLTKNDSNGFWDFNDTTYIHQALTYTALILSGMQNKENHQKKMVVAKILSKTAEVLSTPCIHNLISLVVQKFQLPKNFGKTIKLDLRSDDPVRLAFYARELLKKHAKTLIPTNYNNNYAVNFCVCTVQEMTKKTGPFNFKHVVGTMNTLSYILCKHKKMFTIEERGEMMIAALCHEIMQNYYYNEIGEELIVEFLMHTDGEYYDKISYVISNFLLQSHWIKYNSHANFRYKTEKIYRLLTMCRKRFYTEEKYILQRLIEQNLFDFNNKSHRNLLMMSVLIVSSMTSNHNFTFDILANYYIFFYEDVDTIEEKSRQILQKINKNKIDLKQTVMIYFHYVVVPWIYTVKNLLPHVKHVTRHVRHHLRIWNELSTFKRIWIPQMTDVYN